ncbi:MAG: tetratricopeptide repeat protein, partial [Sphingobacteriales bacterium]
LSNQLLTLRRLEDARIITDNNLKEFPNKDLILVTSGNIYNALGRKEEAKKLYEQALAINPQYEEAKNRLKEMK